MSQTNTEIVATQVDEYLNDLVSKEQFSGSVLIAKDDQIIISKGYGMANYEHDVPNTPYTKFKIYSISKQFTAMAIMILHEEGVLSVHDPICNYLDNCPQAWEPITIYHLLIQTSGLENYFNTEGITDLLRLPKTLETFIDLIRERPLKFTPGTQISRNDSNFLLLTAIIESATGKSYADFVKEKIFEPLGMFNSGVDKSEMVLKHRASGYSRDSGGSLANTIYELVDAQSGGGHIYSTVEDMYLWHLALETNQLVSQQTLDDILLPCNSNYGSDCYVLPIPVGGNNSQEVFGHVGGWWGFRAYLGRIPAENVCLVVLMNIDFGQAGQVNSDLHDMIANIPLLTAHWKLDETDGGIAHDSAGQNDGTLKGEPFWQPAEGMVDGAILLDGVDDSIDVGAVLNPSDGPFSVVAWVKGGAPGQTVISQADGFDWLGTDPLDGSLMTELHQRSGRLSSPLLSQTIITDGEWHRIGFVFDGSFRKLYIDGLVVAQDAQSSLRGSENGIYIGTGKAMEPGTYWSGLIDDVRIYNRVVIP